MDLQAELQNIIENIDGYKFGPIEITSDEELRQIIAADGDEEKEEAIAS